MTKMKVALYLIRRLKELGVKHVFGVPGDFNLEMLDLVEDEEGIKWIGGCNELNAGYAADGYARVNKMGALITTFGVGELSAINAIAGSYAEMVPVVHIVGTPSTKSQAEGAMLHHTLGNGNFRIYMKMYEGITVAQTSLNPKNAKSEIDRVLRECYIKARPVYISLPTDVYGEEIEVDLSDDLNLSYPENPREVEDAAINQIVKEIQKAKCTIVLADVGTTRYSTTKELLDFVEKTGFPIFTSPMGKGVISENHPLFGGTYIGNVSELHIRQEVEGADLILSIGALKSDFNTGGFTYRVSTKKTIEFRNDHVKIFFAVYENVSMRQILPKLTSRLVQHQHGSKRIRTPYLSQPPIEEINSQQITHSWLWKEISSKFFKPNDIIIAETGTSMFGLMDVRFPEGATFISQILYGSIGYSIGATLGAALAAKNNEIKRRVILFVGDGSLQVTVQEISTIIRNNLDPIIFILNNDGYTIERMIHGLERKYNDIQPWQYCKTLEYFGATSAKGKKAKFTKI
ncbi:thiamine diphosphate-binding protein [Glomus cerebriforme]|uniref:Thiamine diphosphate-binding protein n=1 Tax=Glomus cerebriforme TaxID=658196 RepID=A0A397SNA3_9GLOM|nr:thiamine diphosphate-binding protein [Glomus cerebriforme]